MPKRSPGSNNDDDINKRFGARLRYFRERMGRSQSEVGDALGVSFQQIQKYENGTTSISLNRLQDVASFLQVSIVKLVGGLQGASSGAASGFAEDAQTPYDDQEPVIATGPHMKQKVALVDAFSRIDDSQVRKRLISLAEAICARSRDDED